jgi:hypothetical protein
MSAAKQGKKYMRCEKNYAINEEYFDGCDWTASKYREAAHIHAYLHRHEGDEANAHDGVWLSRAISNHYVLPAAHHHFHRHLVRILLGITS